MIGNPKTRFIIIFVCALIFLTGIMSALLFRQIRYSIVMKPDIADIAPKDAYAEILNNGSKVIFLDVRTEDEYNKAHASSSVSVPIHKLLKANTFLPKNSDQTIYLICNGGSLAGVAYNHLEHNGYRNIKRVTGGIKQWGVDGLPITFKSMFSGSKQ